MTRHESPAVGDAVVRMLRGLVRRAGEGDTEAVEQLQRIDRLAGQALSVGVLAATRAGYSTRDLGRVLGVSGPMVMKRLDHARDAVATYSHPGGCVHPDVARLMVAVPPEPSL